MYPIRKTPVATTSFDQELLSTQARDVTANAIPAEDQALIISKLSLLFSQEREHLITQVAPLVTDTMSMEDRIYIISRLSFIPENERKALIRQVLDLLSNSMSDEDRIFIISRVSFMSERERGSLVMQALPLIKDDMSVTDRRAVIEKGIRLLHRKYRFRINSSEIIGNPIKILLDIFETLVRNSIQLSSYSIDYIDVDVIDDSGLMRSFVAKLTESFCNPKYSLVTETELGAIPTLNLIDPFFFICRRSKKML